MDDDNFRLILHVDIEAYVIDIVCGSYFGVL